MPGGAGCRKTFASIALYPIAAFRLGIEGGVELSAGMLHIFLRFTYGKTL